MTIEARVCAAAFFVYLGVGATGPILPEVRRSLTLSPADIGVVVAAFGLARLCVDLPGGALAARLGFRAPFLLGSLLLAAGSTLDRQVHPKFARSSASSPRANSLQNGPAGWSSRFGLFARCRS